MRDEKHRRGVERLLTQHRRRLPHERRRFLRWWDKWVRADVPGTLEKLLKKPSWRPA